MKKFTSTCIVLLAGCFLGLLAISHSQTMGLRIQTTKIVEVYTENNLPPITGTGVDEGHHLVDQTNYIFSENIILSNPLIIDSSSEIIISSTNSLNSDLTYSGTGAFIRGSGFDELSIQDIIISGTDSGQTFLDIDNFEAFNTNRITIEAFDNTVMDIDTCTGAVFLDFIFVTDYEGGISIVDCPVIKTDNLIFTGGTGTGNTALDISTTGALLAIPNPLFSTVTAAGFQAIVQVNNGIFDISSGNNGLNIDSGINLVGGMLFTGNLFLGDGSFFKAGSLIEQVADIRFEANLNIPDSPRVFASMNQQDNTILTDIITVDVWEKVENFSAGQLSNWSFSNSTLTSDFIDTTYEFEGVITFEITGVTGQLIEVSLALNGVVVPETIRRLFVKFKDEPAFLSGQTLGNVTMNDTIEVMIRNTTSAEDILVTHASAIVTRVK